MQWDAAGRIWVVEMPSYMNTPAATGELEPINRISVLEDTNGDGVMDKKTVFLDQLVMPRALCLAYGGVLVCEPPALSGIPSRPGSSPASACWWTRTLPRMVLRIPSTPVTARRG